MYVYKRNLLMAVYCGDNILIFCVLVWVEYNVTEKPRNKRFVGRVQRARFDIRVLRRHTVYIYIVSVLRMRGSLLDMPVFNRAVIRHIITVDRIKLFGK